MKSNARDADLPFRIATRCFAAMIASGFTQKTD
jgi:hypothetical protein